MTETRSLWDAVDKLVAPSRVKLDRQNSGTSTDPTWLEELAAQTDGVCLVKTFRSATAVWAVVPSLWDQATIALYGAEAASGRGSKPLRERSVADLNLMEIRQQVIEGIRWEQENRGETAPTGDFTSDEVRHVASLVQRATPEHADSFASRLASWARALETYLQAGEHETKPVRLRDCPCPTCGTKQITIDRDGAILPFNPAEDHHDGDRQVVSAIVIKFRGELVQCALCEACGDTWWRGDDLERLAQSLGIGFYAPMQDDERIGA